MVEESESVSQATCKLLFNKRISEHSMIESQPQLMLSEAASMSQVRRSLVVVGTPIHQSMD